MNIQSLNKNDCAIVAFSHYFGIDYDSVTNELQSYANELGINWIRTNGTPIILIRCYCLKHKLRLIKTPRRGQDKITGIVHMYSDNFKRHHLVAMIDGYVFDIAAPNGMPIKDYQSTFTIKHVREVWSA